MSSEFPNHLHKYNSFRITNRSIVKPLNQEINSDWDSMNTDIWVSRFID